MIIEKQSQSDRQTDLLKADFCKKKLQEVKLILGLCLAIDDVNGAKIRIFANFFSERRPEMTYIWAGCFQDVLSPTPNISSPSLFLCKNFPHKVTVLGHHQLQRYQQRIVNFFAANAPQPRIMFHNNTDFLQRKQIRQNCLITNVRYFPSLQCSV